MRLPARTTHAPNGIKRWQVTSAKRDKAERGSEVNRTLLTTFMAALLISLAAIAWLRSQKSEAQEPPVEDPTSSVAARLGGAAIGSHPPHPATAEEPAKQGVGATEKADRRKRLADESSIVRARTFEDLLNTYDSLARTRLEDFNRRYGDVIAFGSQEELDWLASNGYPLPAEILEAAAMSLAELREIAEGGDEKAEFLYFDRLNQELTRSRDRHAGAGLDPGTVGESREYMEAFVAADMYRRRIADNASPFTGYALARFYEDTLQNPYAAIAALYLSGSRGDHVANTAADQLLRRYRIGSEARDALASYTLVLRDRDHRYYQAAPRPGGSQ